jgi:hypothetical protein
MGFFDVVLVSPSISKNVTGGADSGITEGPALAAPGFGIGGMNGTWVSDTTIVL